MHTAYSREQAFQAGVSKPTDSGPRSHHTPTSFFHLNNSTGAYPQCHTAHSLPGDPTAIPSPHANALDGIPALRHSNMRDHYEAVMIGAGVQVTTRFLTTCMALYWYMAYLVLRCNTSPLPGKLVLVYCTVFAWIGLVLFPNFYPWT